MEDPWRQQEKMDGHRIELIVAVGFIAVAVVLPSLYIWGKGMAGSSNAHGSAPASKISAINASYL